MLPEKTSAQIEDRVNIINPRVKRLIESYHETTSQLSKRRIQRLITQIEKELLYLESQYRIAKHREFKMGKFLKEIPGYRLN